MKTNRFIASNKFWVLCLIVGVFFTVFLPLFSTNAETSETIFSPTPTPIPKDAEIVFWESIKDSKNVDDYKAYLKKFPDGIFADLAKNKITALEAEKKQVPEKTMDLDDQYWQGIKNSKNQNDFRKYLLEFPNGKYREIAQNNVIKLVIQSENYYRLISEASGRCLDIDDNFIGKDGAFAQQWQCHDRDNQSWRITPFRDGYRISLKASGKCLDVDDNNIRRNGARVQQWSCNGGDNQTWYISVIDEGFTLTSKASGSCLDVDDTNLSNNGARVQQWGCHSKNNQIWRIVRKPVQ